MSSLRPIDRVLSEDSASSAVIDELLRQGRKGVAARLCHVRRPDAAVGITRSPLGPLLVAVGPAGILMISYLRGRDAADEVAALRLKFDPVEDRRAAEEVGDQIRRFLAGDREALSYRADLTLVAGKFQRRLLDRLRQVPFGAVVTYRALGDAIGAPDSQRAVGNAMGANPIPIYVPCHRVVRSDGMIGHYAGGTQVKVKLLRAEGFAVDNNRRLPQQVVWGHLGTRIFCRPHCAAARRADTARLLIFAGPQSARHAGMRPCKLCRPC